jgi:hypothetical protein
VEVIADTDRFSARPMIAFLAIEVVRIAYGANAAMQRRSRKLQVASDREPEGLPAEA